MLLFHDLNCYTVTTPGVYENLMESVIFAGRNVLHVFTCPAPTFQIFETGEFSTLQVSFRLQRHMGYFLIQVYVPCTLIVILSWVSFWINREATADRVGLGRSTPHFFLDVLPSSHLSTSNEESFPQNEWLWIETLCGHELEILEWDYQDSLSCPWPSLRNTYCEYFIQVEITNGGY